MAEASSTWIELALQDGVNVLRLQGPWRLASLPELVAQIQALNPRVDLPCLVDGSNLEELDTAAGFMLFSHLFAQGFLGSQVALRGMDPRHERLLALVRDRMEAPSVNAPTPHQGIVQHVGAATERLLSTLLTHNAFIGNVSLELLSLLRRPGLFRFRETVSQFESVVLDGIPIVALVTFLIGVVFAYLLGLQAQQFGATIFVVDGVGLAICRELAPILVAVIIAGRSGAAFTAQIGSMKVQDETDAIRTLGLSPIQVLVVPRLVAIMLGLPFLVFIGDLAGIGGGMLIGALQLDISPTAFLSRLRTTLPLSALVIGLAKAPVFAAFIAMIACRMGMTVDRDARSVGEHTTSTVVQSIVWVIVLDAIFAVTLQRLDL
jgi:phospholipid/cholesterol/gamma-HCH transport system permease protein